MQQLARGDRLARQALAGQQLVLQALARQGIAAEQAQTAVGAVHHIAGAHRSEEHTSELQSLTNLVCRLLLEKKKSTPALVRPGERALRTRERGPPGSRLRC